MQHGLDWICGVQPSRIRRRWDPRRAATALGFKASGGRRALVGSLSSDSRCATPVLSNTLSLGMFLAMPSAEAPVCTLLAMPGVAALALILLKKIG